jgi:hypothetical protein
VGGAVHISPHDHSLVSTSSQNFNEIMPCIYARFMEKEARQWRQIYKVRFSVLLREPHLDIRSGAPAHRIPNQTRQRARSR